MIKNVKSFLFGKEPLSRPILFGKASRLKMVIDPLHKSQRLLGLDEREIAASFVRFSKRSDVLVDVGSSDGYYGLLYRKYNASGVIISCDFDDRFLSIQKANYADNDFQTSDNFLFVRKMIADRQDDQTTTLDEILSAHRFVLPFIKIDVDGGELSVLHGATQTLASHACMLIIETHSKELEDSCIAFLSSLNYSARIIDNAWWRFLVPEKRNLPHNRWLLAFKI